ncbi:MAG: 50S ribosomal protein L4 [Mycoplasmataceae bacterium]|nr:MAG: 50S ribosomal protein L4 [Mycoplasmataceae bacterium]
MEQIEIINHKGEVVSNVSSNSILWQTPLSPKNISLSNRSYLANQRQGTKKTKRKGEVSGGGIKPWRQKGTGRARSGSIRNPQFRGGGVVFGPTGEENYSLNVNKKFKKNVLQSLLREKLEKKELLIIDKIVLENYKTKEAEKLLQLLLSKKAKTLIVLADDEENKAKIINSFRNLPYVNLSSSKTINSYQALYSEKLIFTQSAFSEIEARLN